MLHVWIDFDNQEIHGNPAYLGMTLAEAETAVRSSRNCQICGTFSWPRLKPLCLQGAATACSMWSQMGQMAHVVSYLTGVKLLLCDAGTRRRSARSSMCSCNLWLWLPERLDFRAGYSIRWISLNFNVLLKFLKSCEIIFLLLTGCCALGGFASRLDCRARQCFAGGMRDSPLSCAQFTL